MGQSGEALITGQTTEYPPSLFPLSICDEGLETRDGGQFPVRSHRWRLLLLTVLPFVTPCFYSCTSEEIAFICVILDLFEHVITKTQGFLRGYKTGLGHFRSATFCFVPQWRIQLVRHPQLMSSLGCAPERIALWLSPNKWGAEPSVCVTLGGGTSLANLVDPVYVWL